MKQLKRKRKSNYSVRETQTLIREIHKRQDVLFSRQQNTAINELKRQAWEEVAGGVNALGEGELRTAAEVKRRYLDWRALMKRKQLRAELSVCLSSASSLALKEEYEPCSPEHDAAMLGSACELLDLSGFPKDHHCGWPELAGLGEPSGHMMMTSSTATASGVKMEEDASEYRTDSDRDVADGDGELDEDDCFPSLLGEMASRGEVCVPEAYCHIDELGALASSSSSSKAPTSTTPTPNASISTTHRDFPPLALGGALAGLDCAPPPQGEAGAGAAAAAVLAAVETQRLELERQRLAVETERLAVEREQLAVQRERLQTERERCRLEQERLRALLLGQARRAAEEPAQQGTPSSSTAPDGRQEPAGADEGRGPGWRSGSAAAAVAAELETERLRLDKERLQLEKERLQFFKFESGRLQIERERLQVDKERMMLQKDHH